MNPFSKKYVRKKPAGYALYWDDIVGIYAKIEQGQFDNPSVHMPLNYPSFFYDPLNPATNYVDADTNPFKKPAINQNSIYWELDHYLWLKGLQVDLDFGIESAPGVRDWSRYDNIFRTVERLRLVKGQNKKVFILIPCKTFDVADGLRQLPADMRSRGVDYEAGFPRYDYLMGYVSTSTQDGADPWGYHFRFADWRDNATGLDKAGRPIHFFRERYLDFFQAFYDRYKNSPALAGFLTIEPSPVTRTGFPSSAYDQSDYNRNNHFAGRLQFLQELKKIVTNHVLIEAGNHDHTWEQAMFGPGANAGGAITLGIGATGPNIHLGANLDGIYDAMENLAGIVPIMAQYQPQDAKSLSGGIRISGVNNDYYAWTPTPNSDPPFNCDASNPYGPLTEGPTGPVTYPGHPIIRSQWLMANFLSYQRNISSGYPVDWAAFCDWMENSCDIISPNIPGGATLIWDDPSGGLNKAIPLYLAMAA